MLYYKLTDKKGFITLQDFRFYHPQRKRMFTTLELKKAQYIIFEGQYYRVPWLSEECEEIKGKYPEMNIVFADKEEYMEWLEKQNSEQK